MLVSWFRVVALALLVIPLAGCVGLAMGGGPGKGTATAAGPVKANVNAPIERVYAAAQTTLKSKQLAVLSKSQNSSSARVTSKFSDGQDVSISISAVTPAVCEVTVRTGGANATARARELLNGIKARL